MRTNPTREPETECDRHCNRYLLSVYPAESDTSIAEMVRYLGAGEIVMTTELIGELIRRPPRYTPRTSLTS
jgi:hypothetical protein